MITVAYKPNFIRQFNKLLPKLKDEVEEKILLFQHEPRHPSLRTHKLGGKLKGFLAFSVNYSYRVVFLWENKKSAVLLAVGDHSVYD